MRFVGSLSKQRKDVLIYSYTFFFVFIYYYFLVVTCVVFFIRFVLFFIRFLVYMLSWQRRSSDRFAYNTARCLRLVVDLPWTRRLRCQLGLCLQVVARQSRVPSKIRCTCYNFVEFFDFEIYFFGVFFYCLRKHCEIFNAVSGPPVRFFNRSFNGPWNIPNTLEQNQTVRIIIIF